ncbi:hypothetical protein H8959_004816 [Pygathrix nigripes]
MTGSPAAPRSPLHPGASDSRSSRGGSARRGRGPPAPAPLPLGERPQRKVELLPARPPPLQDGTAICSQPTPRAAGGGLVQGQTPTTGKGLKSCVPPPASPTPAVRSRIPGKESRERQEQGQEQPSSNAEVETSSLPAGPNPASLSFQKLPPRRKQYPFYLELTPLPFGDPSA